MATVSLITAQYKEVRQIHIYQTKTSLYVKIKSKRSRRSSRLSNCSLANH